MKRLLTSCCAFILAVLTFGTEEAMGQTPFCTGYSSNQECRDWCNEQGDRDFMWIANCLEGCEDCKWECVGDGDCTTGDKNRCHYTECVECFRKSHCDPGEICPFRTCQPGGCSGDEDCRPDELCNDCRCELVETPILISTQDREFELTSWQDGVNFDIDADGVAERTAWTAARNDDAFLVLDRNGNGLIDDATELFGNHAEQLPSDAPNGFRALARLDDLDLGGNRDGMISAEDRLFSRLQLWFDNDHNGSAGPRELHPLSRFAVAIDLDYRTFDGADEHGNRFAYKATVHRRDGGIRIACDVLFIVRPDEPHALPLRDILHPGRQETRQSRPSVRPRVP